MVIAVVVPQVSADGPTNRTERAEVRFLEGMIDHHQMALDMAHDCLMKASTDSVVQLCQNVITAQSREIEVMRGYLLDWYGIEYQPKAMPMMMGSGDPVGMMGMMSGFASLTGRDYEIAWLEAMIDHHDDALHMSERILKVTGRSELQTLAQGIIDAQTAEIAQMEDMIADLSAMSS